MAMSLISCTTLLSHRAPAPTLVKSSPGAGSLTLQLGSRQPAPLRWASSIKESQSRAAFFACNAMNKYSYHIEPTALVYRPPSGQSATNWKILEEKDLIILGLEVGDLGKEKLNVSTTDHVLLVAKYTGDINEEPRASSLDVRLLMPPGYDEKNVHATLSKGWLNITIPKPKHEPNTIEISSTET